jgi:hypothetical protein
MENSFVAKLLIELLFEYNRVSLPCLGSFIGQYKPSDFSSDKKNIHPPSKQIEFHQNEIWNDEHLEKLIAQYHNISLGNAKEKLAFWVDNVCAELSMKKTVKLPLFGEFMVSYGNRLKFIQYNEQNLLVEAFGLETVKINKPQVLSTANLPAATIQGSAKTNNNKEENNNLHIKKRLWLWLAITLITIITFLAALAYFDIIKIPLLKNII